MRENTRFIESSLFLRDLQQTSESVTSDEKYLGKEMVDLSDSH